MLRTFCRLYLSRGWYDDLTRAASLECMLIPCSTTDLGTYDLTRKTVRVVPDTGDLILRTKPIPGIDDQVKEAQTQIDKELEEFDQRHRRNSKSAGSTGSRS